MESIVDNNGIAQTTRFLPDVIIAITTLFFFALKWTLMITFERYNATWVVQSVMEFPDVHFNPNTTHVSLASDSSLVLIIYMVVNKQLILETSSLNYPLIYEVWM